MGKIKLSIVIVNFNNKDLTLKCLASIQKETTKLSFEVLLVDNGSDDGSLKEFNDLKQKLFWRKRLLIIANNTNTGYAKANNQGIKKAKGEYVLLLNNDTLVRKNSISNLINFADSHSDAGVVGSKLFNMDGSVQKSCFRFPTILNAIRESWFDQKGLLDSYSPDTTKPIVVDSLVGAVFLITSEARKRVGLLDERYFAYYEDMDYCRRVWKAGLKVYFLPESVVTHYHGATFKKLADKDVQWKRLIPGSKIYNGILKHYLIFIIMWLGQKWHKLILRNN